VVVEQDYVDAAVRAAHTAFGLDVTDGESAVVYGGTGR
jgi:aspartate kinase